MKAIIIVELNIDSKNRDDYSIQLEVKDIENTIKEELAFTYIDEAFNVCSVITKK